MQSTVFSTIIKIEASVKAPNGKYAVLQDRQISRKELAITAAKLGSVPYAPPKTTTSSNQSSAPYVNTNGSWVAQDAGEFGGTPFGTGSYGYFAPGTVVTTIRGATRIGRRTSTSSSDCRDLPPGSCTY